MCGELLGAGLRQGNLHARDLVLQGLCAVPGQLLREMLDCRAWLLCTRGSCERCSHSTPRGTVCSKKRF